MTEPPIFTPDRRLRVFVSSTLGELAPERGATREAISSLRLAPVLFEQGARPHAPRDLYAAYVDQSDVFVGIYWQSYGWVAPGAAISGIEDEFELGQGKPMLIYVKDPAPSREDGLTALIGRVAAEAGVSYRKFATADELRGLVTNDLAHLLTERFHAHADAPAERSGLPARTASFVGRGRELTEILELLERPDVRLVTLTGPGGIGKTELGLEVARRRGPDLVGGAAYVTLDRLSDPELVPVAIADAVGLSSLGANPEAALAPLLREQQLLLLLDNFEHLLDAAPLVTRLLKGVPNLEVLVTSREPLHLQGEHEYPVPPLADAPMLFMERASAVRPQLVWNDENTRAAETICAQVDGLPLAVELVAAAARMLEPRVLVDQLFESSLDAPTVGRRDAPARQLTMRAAMDWSYGLLAEPERDLFSRLGVFSCSFTIEAARSVSTEGAPLVLSTLSGLVDKSLLQHEESASETRFRMLRMVSEYAAERFAGRAGADEIRDSHAAYYLELALAAHAGLRGSEQRAWKEVLDLERENVRAAIAHLARHGRVDEAATIAWSLLVYWFASSYPEGRKVIAPLLAAGQDLSDRSRARLQTLDGLLAALLSDMSTARAQLEPALEWFEAHPDEEGRANALAGLGLATAPSDPGNARTLMLESAHLFAEVGDVFGETIVLNALGWLDAGMGEFTAPDSLEHGYVLARGLGNAVTTAHAATNLAELRLSQQRLDEAREFVLTALGACEAVRLYDGASYTLEPAALIANTTGDSAGAVRLLGAADKLRKDTGIPIWGPRRDRFETFLGSLRESLGGEEFETAWNEGQSLDFDASLAAARRAVRSPR